MASILLKDVPEDLHQRLKVRAEGNRRSMSQEVLHILEHGLVGRLPATLPALVKPKRPLTTEDVVRAVREGRK